MLRWFDSFLTFSFGTYDETFCFVIVTTTEQRMYMTQLLRHADEARLSFNSGKISP